MYGTVANLEQVIVLFRLGSTEYQEEESLGLILAAYSMQDFSSFALLAMPR